MRIRVFFIFIALSFMSIAHSSPQYLSWNSLSKEQKMLIEKASSAREHAYAPYSNYYVGAALQTEAGQIITGTNVENASYGLTICAERTAIFKAVSEGKSHLKSMALVTKNGGMPCGACRQVMHEFNPNMEVIISDIHRKKILVVQLKSLLPGSFGSEYL